jgi:hypothetical protein
LARRLYNGSFGELARILLTGGDFHPSEIRRIRALLRRKKRGSGLNF